MSDNHMPALIAGRAVNAIRTSTIISAVAGIVLGLIMLFWPGITVLIMAILFGIALILAGLYRIAFGVTVGVKTGLRWLMVILGVLMVIAGVLCLVQPAVTLLFIAVIIGVAWIFEGIHSVIAGIAGSTLGPRWVSLVGGAVGVIAGIVVLSSPGLALGTFAMIGGILLILVSVGALASLPRKIATG